MIAGLYTTRELAEAAGIPYDRCKWRLPNWGIERADRVGNTNLYDETALKRVKGER